jgi:hypothetical protein
MHGVTHSSHNGIDSATLLRTLDASKAGPEIARFNSASRMAGASGWNSPSVWRATQKRPLGNRAGASYNARPFC